MISFDELVPNYRRARDRWSEAPALVRHYDTVLEAYFGTGQSLIECVKSYVECVCRTILVDYGLETKTDASMTDLLVAALSSLGFRSTRSGSRFDRVLSAHNKLADALSDSRNHEAPIAHGKDGFLDSLANHHVRLYLLTGDAILSLLLGALDGSEPSLIHTREPYERFEHFNSAIDESVYVETEVDYDDGVVVLGFKTTVLSEGLKLRVEPSRLLYALDRTAYVEILESLPSTFELAAEVVNNTEKTQSSFPSVVPEVPPLCCENVHNYCDRFEVVRDGLSELLADGGASKEKEEKTQPSFPLVAPEVPPLFNENVSSYCGRFEVVRDGLSELLAEQGVSKETVACVLDSLLAAIDETAVLDWQIREPMSARMRIALKRVLKSVGPKHPSPNKLAEIIQQWFIENEPGTSKQGRRKTNTKHSEEMQV